MGLIRKPPATAADDSATEVASAPPALDAADPQCRRDALHACVGRPERLLEVIGRLGLETDPHVRSVLMTCLVDSQSELAAQALAKVLEEEDVALRSLAIAALGEMPEAAMKVLPPLLAASDADVRIFAVTVIGAIGGPQAATLLGYVLGHDEHVNVVDAAINSIVEIGSREHVKSLLVARRRFAGNPYITFAANAAISALGHAPPTH